MASKDYKVEANDIWNKYTLGLVDWQMAFEMLSTLEQEAGDILIDEDSIVEDVGQYTAVLSYLIQLSKERDEENL